MVAPRRLADLVPPASFDAVIAAGSLQCNRLAEAQAIAAQARGSAAAWTAATSIATGCW